MHLINTKPTKITNQEVIRLPNTVYGVLHQEIKCTFQKNEDVAYVVDEKPSIFVVTEELLLKVFDTHLQLPL